MRIRVIMPAIIDQAGRPFNVDGADGISRRHRLLRGYISYYNTARPHQSLDNNSPQPREVHPPELGSVVAIPHVGGLHHLYQRAA